MAPFALQVRLGTFEDTERNNTAPALSTDISNSAAKRWAQQQAALSQEQNAGFEKLPTNPANRQDSSTIEVETTKLGNNVENKSLPPSKTKINGIGSSSSNSSDRSKITTASDKESAALRSEARSKQRLLKAKKLLEMAQVSPSQRLEMEGIMSVANPAQNFGNNAVNMAGTLNNNNIEWREIEEAQMRMADTFDSVDNLVDSKSLLPGGRWVSTSTTGPENVPKNLPNSKRNTSNEVTANPESLTLASISAGKVAEPLVQYDPIAAERNLFRQPGKWLVRNVQIAFPFGIWVAGVLIDNLLGQELQNRRNRAKELNSIIAGLGPAIIKAGQALASRPDLLPSEYLDELQKLQDDVPTFSNDIAFRIVEEELKMKFDDVFELMEKEPIAAASIGQVYKARLKKNGQTVALKIQRPNTENIVELDLYVLRWWGGVYNAVFRLLGRDIDLQSVMDDFGALLYAEIDYIAEAANARRFSELYAQDVAIAGVFVPKVYSELTTRKVLTMEWVDGFRLTDSESLEAFNLDRKKLVDTLVQCSLRQIMENGFFHADPHAGNLLATRDGRLCYLDFGMMSYAAAAQRNGFLLAVVHIVNRDWGELVRVYQRLGFIPEDTDVRPIELALEDAMPDVLDADISELNFKNVVGRLGDIMYTYPFSLPPFYISIIRCLGVLEGLAIQVDPKARIISEAYPYVANRVLTDSQDDLKEALRRLIFTNEGHIRWGRLESLLDEAKESSGFDIVSTLDKLIDYVISSDGEELLNDIADQIVNEADSLGRETLLYISQVLSALSIRDERGAAKALQLLVEAMQDSAENPGADGEYRAGVRNIINSVWSNLSETLPEPTPAMQRTLKLALLLGTRGASSLTSSAVSNNAAADTANTIAKFIPLARKLSSEPKVTQKASETVARLGERIVSRGLRAAFGLPPPTFESI